MPATVSRSLGYLLVAGLVAVALSSARGQAALRPIESVEAALIVPGPAGLVIVDDNGRRRLVPGSLPGDRTPAVSPDGRQIAVSRSGDLYVIDAWSKVTRRLTFSRRSLDEAPAWSPDGRYLVWASGRPGALDLWRMGADGKRAVRLVGGAGSQLDPTFTPSGDRVLYVSNEAGDFDLYSAPADPEGAPAGGPPGVVLDTPLDERHPAIVPGGQAVLYSRVQGSRVDIWRTTLSGAPPARAVDVSSRVGWPVLHPDGGRLAYLSWGRENGVWIASLYGTGGRHRVSGAAAPRDGVAWARLAPGPDGEARDRLPDLDQRVPAGLVVVRSGDRVLLGFASAVDNIGAGPLRIRGVRASSDRIMRADQLIERRGGRVRVQRDVGVLRYTPHPPHYHWHFQPFERYELRDPQTLKLIARDRKSGFCLADHYGHAATRVGRLLPPRFLGDCGKGRPGLVRVDQGSSVGYTDRYPALFHGQDIDITGVPPGVYVLVHRANPERRVIERRYDNNAASLRIRIRGAAGPGTEWRVSILRSCPDTEDCPVPR